MKEKHYSTMFMLMGCVEWEWSKCLTGFFLTHARFHGAYRFKCALLMHLIALGHHNRTEYIWIMWVTSCEIISFKSFEVKQNNLQQQRQQIHFEIVSILNRITCVNRFYQKFHFRLKTAYRFKCCLLWIWFDCFRNTSDA